MSRPGLPGPVAIDIIPSANIPKLIYRKEVVALKRAHPTLIVIICVHDDFLGFHPDAEYFCQEIECGLQAYIPEVGLQTIVTTILDRDDELKVKSEDGWFPKCILEKAAKATSLSFHPTIVEFCRKVRRLGNDERAVTDLVTKTIDKLLQYYPSCHADVGSFMKLARFESIFRPMVPGSTDHVLHSFRVFLAGCSVIDRHYRSFLSAQKRFCLGSPKKLSIEYGWLLTAVFHDIGQPLQRGSRFLEAELEDEDVVVSVSGRNTRWLRTEYVEARRIISSLGTFVSAGAPVKDEWDGGALVGPDADRLADRWTALFDQMSSHAVIGAFKMLASIVEQAIAVNEKKNHTFVISHAVPAALAILLHDWRIWDDAKKWKLFPVNSGLLPMAALLIYIDTWDDFKRKGLDSPISIESFDISDSRVVVSVKWLKAKEYEKEKIKYAAFKRALKNRPFGMNIRVQVASTQ